MIQHTELIEFRARKLIDQSNEPQGEEPIHEFKVLLHRMREDAAIMQEEMPTQEAQEMLREIAFATIEKLERMLHTFSKQNKRQLQQEERSHDQL